MSALEPLVHATQMEIDLAGISSSRADFLDWLANASDDAKDALGPEDWAETFIEGIDSIQRRTAAGGGDPVLAELALISHQRKALDRKLAFLVAYARERVTPRPYTLQQVAEASGMSISGVRTYYDQQTLAELDEQLAEARAVYQAEVEKNESLLGPIKKYMAENDMAFEDVMTLLFAKGSDALATPSDRPKPQ